MSPRAEGEVTIRRAADIEAIRVWESFRIAIGCCQNNRHDVALSDGLLTNIDGLQCDQWVGCLRW